MVTITVQCEMSEEGAREASGLLEEALDREFGRADHGRPNLGYVVLHRIREHIEIHLRRLAQERKDAEAELVRRDTPSVRERRGFPGDRSGGPGPT